MPMTGIGLFNAVKAAFPPAADSAMQEAALKPLCEKIVEYLIANAIVSVTVATTGSAAAQTGTGTGTIA